MMHANALHRSAPRDCNQVFLPMISTHHQALVTMSHSEHPRAVEIEPRDTDLDRRTRDMTPAPQVISHSLIVRRSAGRESECVE